MNYNENFEDVDKLGLSNEAYNEIQTSIKIQADLSSVLGDYYSPNLSLKDLWIKSLKEELFFLTFGDNQVWIPGRQQVRKFYSKKYHEEREHKILGFNHASLDKRYLSIYFDVLAPEEIIISKTSYETNPELKDKSVSQILEALGFGKYWLIVPKDSYRDCLAIIDHYHPKKSKPNKSLKTDKARSDVTNILGTKKFIENQMTTAKEMLTTPARNLAQIMLANYRTMIQVLEDYLKQEG